MKKILFLTNKNNGAFEEDSQLIDFLSKDFEITVSHPLDCLPLPSNAEGIIIRNIWPTHEYAKEWKSIQQKIKESKIPTYNSLTGKGDINRKGYLLELSKMGYPVIPTIDNLDNLYLLEDSEYYWVKPKDGCDGSGSGKYTKEDLFKKDLKDHIIQPYIEFTSEPSFFYVDNVFSHAITTPNRLTDKDIEVYKPTEEELAFAQRFVEWNTLGHGIQRIDAVKTKEGKLLLTEVEDLCPYLYIDDIDLETKKVFLEKVAMSLKMLLM